MASTYEEWVQKLRNSEPPPGTFNWYEWPEFIRFQFIDRMDRVTKLWYYLCSDQSSLDMPRVYLTNLQIFTDVTKIKTRDDRMDTMYLKFSGGRGSCDVRLLAKNRETMVREPGTVSETMSRYFNRLFRKSTKLKTLILDNKEFPFQNTSIKHLTNLNYLVLNLQTPEMIDSGFTSFEQLYKIRSHLNVKHIKLELSQLIQFTAGIVSFESAIISSEDLNQYLKLFVNGKTQLRTRELLMYIDKDHLLEVDRIVEGLDTLGSHEDEEIEKKTYFALVSSENPRRIGIVKYNKKFFKIEFLSEKVFRTASESALYKIYGNAVEEYMKKDVSVD